VALVYAQLTHSIGLNDVCDALRLQSGPLSSIRGATPPTRNTLSHADKVRPAEMAQKLFWAVFEHLSLLSPNFVSGTGRKRFASKFKRAIHLVDSTTIPLIASCMDWAKHRRRKAAAKCHLRLDLQSFLPRFACAFLDQVILPAFYRRGHRVYLIQLMRATIRKQNNTTSSLKIGNAWKFFSCHPTGPNCAPPSDLSITYA